MEYDHLDRTAAEWLARQRASSRVDYSGHMGMGLLPQHTLRMRCFEELRRSDKGGRVATLYHEDKLSTALEVRGRLVSGIVNIPDDHYLKPTFEKLHSCMREWHAARSMFAAPKLLKEFLRGGADGPCRDFDISRSFPRAILARHPTMRHVEQWVLDSAGAAAEAGRGSQPASQTLASGPIAQNPRDILKSWGAKGVQKGCKRGAKGCKTGHVRLASPRSSSRCS